MKRNNNKSGLVFMMVKPDGVSRRLIGEIIRRIEETDLVLISARFLKPSARLVAAHYKQKRNSSSGLTTKQAVDYLTSGPVFVTIWQGKSAVNKMRKIIGNKTDPFSCRHGTIRRDFANDSLVKAKIENRAVFNVVHSSNNPESAISEIKLWFGKMWRYLYE